MQNIAILRERSITTKKPDGGFIVAIRIVEFRDGEFIAKLQVSWKRGEYVLGLRDEDRPKVVKDLHTFIRRCRNNYGFIGPIPVEQDIVP